jgi:hypothetical protein
MKKTMFFAAALSTCASAFAQQGFDFKLLDKLGANAKESTNITLDGDTLKMASGFLTAKGDDSIKPIIDNLKGVYVRSYEFEKESQYSATDLAPLRAYLNSSRWSKIVDVKEAKETSEIYLQPLPNNQLGGLAIINSEPKEVTVVYISGVMNMSDVGKLGGNLGIPDMKFLNDGKKSGKKSDDSRKD